MRDLYEQFRTEAEALMPPELKPFGFDLPIVRFNISCAIEAIEHLEPCTGGPRLRQLYATLEEVTRLVLNARPMAGNTRELISEVYADRKVLMAMLLSWSHAGLVPQSEVRRIVEGKGPIDAANDVISIVHMPMQHPATLGKLLLESKELDLMVDRAEALIDVLKPAAAPPLVNRRLERARDVQARVWTLLLRQHEVVWKQGAQLFGKAVDDAVPPLRSRVLRKRKAYGAPHESSDPAPA